MTLNAQSLAIVGETSTAPAPPPLFVAVEEAFSLRRRYGATQSDIEYLLSRWRYLHGVPVREHELKVAALAAVLEYPMQPLTKSEAEGVITAAVEAFAGDITRGVEGIRTWCLERGAVTPTHVARLCDAFRARCLAVHPLSDDAVGTPLERTA